MNKYQEELQFDKPTKNSGELEKRFLKYHAENPNIYDALVDLARKSRRYRPDRVIGIQMLFEVLRWNYYTSVYTTEEYKFPNAFAAGYSRLIMKQEPDLKGIFRIAKSEFDTE
jgi:hypothetical protein